MSDYFSSLLKIACVLLPMLGVSCQAQPHFEKIANLPPKVKESSGLVYTPFGLFTVSDNKKPEIFRIDTLSGAILQTIRIEGESFIDKEAIAFDGTWLYVGDFGNNYSNRKDLKIARIPIAAIAHKGDVSVEAEIIYFHYPEQFDFSGDKKSSAFDCEAMVVVDNTIYLFTKQRSDHQSTLYSLPAKAGRHAAKRHSTFNVQGRITEAALSPDGKTLLLLGYQDDHQYPFIWKFTDFKGTQFFTGKSVCKKISDSPLGWQTEGLTFLDGDRLFMSCETNEHFPAALYKARMSAIFK